MPLMLKFPLSTRVEHSDAEVHFMQYASHIRDHLSGRMLPSGLPIDEANGITFDSTLMERLRTPIQSAAVDAESVIQQSWTAATCIHEGFQGRTADDMYEMFNRPFMKVVQTLVGAFIHDEADELVFALKSSEPPAYLQSRLSTQPWAGWKSRSVSDVPSEIRVGRGGLEMRWTNNQGILHRCVDNGPAVVISAPFPVCQVQHYEDGRRVRGHDKWAKRCANSNPWLKFTITQNA